MAAATSYVAYPGLRPDEVETLHILRRVDLESVWGMLEDCPVRHLAAGEALFEAGQGNDTMYMVLSGRLSVHLESATTEPIAFLAAGETVGEISVLDDCPVSAFVLAAETTRLLAVDEETFWRLVGASHAFASNLLFLLAQRMRANNSAISEGVRLRQRYERDAMVDALTALHNRRWLDERLPRMLERHRRSRHAMSLLVIDVDHFKRFNDTYGHLAGDHVLATVARKLATSLRPTDLCARYGGEEFVVMLPDTDLAGAVAAAERIRRAIGAMNLGMIDGRVLPPVTISLGAAEIGGEDSPGSILARADRALYRAKHGGRDRVAT